MQLGVLCRAGGAGYGRGLQALAVRPIWPEALVVRLGGCLVWAGGISEGAKRQLPVQVPPSELIPKQPQLRLLRPDLQKLRQRRHQSPSHQHKHKLHCRREGLHIGLRRILGL